MLRVTVLYRQPASFIMRDIELLKRHFSVTPVQWDHVTGPLELARVLPGTDVFYSWFAGPYAALAVLYGRALGRRTALMLGGYDCAGIVSLRYGAFTSPITAEFVKVAVRGSDAVAAVDPTLVHELRTNMSFNRPISIIPTGYDSSFFRPAVAKEGRVITVATVSPTAAAVKGLSTFARVAAQMRDLDFVVVGAIRDRLTMRELNVISDGRLSFTGFLGPEQLLTEYQRARVVCQLSRHEGLPNALCEAMLCECVPVGTRNGGIPTAIGATGTYCEVGDVQGTVEAIRRALGMSGAEARRRVASNFPLDRRERLLVDLLSPRQESVEATGS